MKDKLTQALQYLKHRQGQSYTQEEMGINTGHLPQATEKSGRMIQGLVDAFYATESIEERETILAQIYNLTGIVPPELGMALADMKKAGKSR